MGNTTGCRRIYTNECWIVSSLRITWYFSINLANSELLWCDFTSPTLHLVSHLNITPPGTPDAPPPLPNDPDSDGPWGRRLPTSPIVQFAHFEWIRSAVHRSFSPQPHITLDYTSFVSFYHPRLQSLTLSRVGKPMRFHRVWADISDADAESVAQEMDEVLQRGGTGSGFDWGLLAVGLVEYWADRVMHLHTLLHNVTSLDSAVNLTKAANSVRMLAYTPLTPYMDSGSARHASGWDIFFGFSSPTAFERCASSVTGFLPASSLTPQEALLQASIEGVLHRLCLDFGVIFAESLDADAPKWEEWDTRVTSLMEWLDWAAWLRCEEACASDVCFPSLLSLL